MVGDLPRKGNSYSQPHHPPAREATARSSRGIWWFTLRCSGESQTVQAMQTMREKAFGMNGVRKAGHAIKAGASPWAIAITR